MAMNPTTQPPAMAPSPAVATGGATPAAVPSTVSLDLPPSIQQLISTPAAGVNERAVGNIPTGTAATNPQYPVLDFRMQPSYAMGGQVPELDDFRNRQSSYQMGGQVPAGLQTGQPTGPMNPQMADMQINDMLAKNPEVVARVRAAIEAGMQSGEISQQEINMAVQLAQVAMQNPQMYPQLRQFAIDRGLVGPNDLPMEYDQGLVTALVVAAKALAADVQLGDGAAQMQQPMQQPPEMATGGLLQGASHANGGVPIKMKGGGMIEAEGGEYIIPKHIVAQKGTEFFDKLIGRKSSKDTDVT